MFIGYWNSPEAMRDEFVERPDGKWLLTGDHGVCDAGSVFYGATTMSLAPPATELALQKLRIA